MVFIKPLFLSPGISESPKEIGSKEEHTKAHDNYITQDWRWENLKSSKRKIELPTKEFP